MKLKRVVGKDNLSRVAILKDDIWRLLDEGKELLEVLKMTDEQLEQIAASEYDEDSFVDSIPFMPSAYRDFMLYEKHAIDSARGFVKKYLPKLFPIVTLYEKILRKPFPKLKPKKRFYKHPIYYMGNHLNFITDKNSIAIPSYTKELDYELELAAFIVKPLKNATINDVNDALGGFMIFNDFSARDVQLDEMDSGFGPMKTKNFGNAISTIVVSKDGLIDRLEDLKVKVIINGKTIVESHTKGKHYSFQEAIAYASWEEQLHPGEVFGSGTIPGCTGIENGVMLKKGDAITLEVEGIGQLTNNVI